MVENKGILGTSVFMKSAEGSSEVSVEPNVARRSKKARKSRGGATKEQAAPVVLKKSVQTQASSIAFFKVIPNSAGFSVVMIPAALRAANLSSAPPFPPAMMAPA